MITDSDNLVSVSEVVPINSGFSEAMTATPTISITGIVTNVIMTPVSGTNSYTYARDTSSGTLSNGTYTATVSGTDLAGNAYSGSDSSPLLLMLHRLRRLLPPLNLIVIIWFQSQRYDNIYCIIL